jgi:quercetin dioxygenase-like cupin family protein
MKIPTMVLISCAALFAGACGSEQTATTNKVKMEDKSENTIFPRGEKAPAETFTGTVYVQPLAPKNENNNFSVASVTFEPGARAFWHSHPAGQTILVTDGKGLYQEKGKAIRALSKGDVVLCDPDIEHWHGASPETAMTHIVITNYKGDSQVNWMRPVTDQEYSAAIK